MKGILPGILLASGSCALHAIEIATGKMLGAQYDQRALYVREREDLHGEGVQAGSRGAAHDV